ncbi:MAG: RNA polymerase sigma factor [Candidatus Pacebacteria bacterium]|nr:RNA polymerase sigma factor [Candidatus Paceibacterota bacterium]
MGLLDKDKALNIADIHEKSDEEVLALSVRRPEAFKVLLERYQAPFLRKALSILRNKEDAEEVVQEAFSKIYLYADRFEVQAGASFSSWGYRILMNTAFTRYQKLKKEWARTQKLDPEVYERLPDTAALQFEKLELSDYIVSVLEQMPEHLARILTRHFIDGRPHKEIAEEEGISVGAVKTRVHRAKEAFRKHVNLYQF